MGLELSYLHLSDLHFEAGAPGGDGWQAEAFEQDLVNRSLLEATANTLHTVKSNMPPPGRPTGRQIYWAMAPSLRRPT